MNDSEMAKILLLDQCCKECISFFIMAGENDEDIYFCGDHNALLNGYLFSVNGLKNRTLQTNVCKYFNDARKFTIPTQRLFPIFEEQDEK